MTSISLQRRFGLLLVVLAIVFDCAVAGSPMDDFGSTKRLAKRENRDIILSFSGYRWWYPTIGFDTQTEHPWIRKHFIMLEVGIPRDSKDSGVAVNVEDRALIELRRMFHQEIDEPGPTILLLDADGRPYAKIDSNEQPAEVYLPDLKDAIQRRIKRDKAFRRASVADGMEKARLLNDGLIALYEIRINGEVKTLSSQELLVDDYYEDIFVEISENDPKDILNRGKELKEKKQSEKEDAERSLMDGEFEKLAGELDHMLDDPPPLAVFFATIDKFIDSHPAMPAEARQRALLGKVEAAIMLRDYPSAIKELDLVISAFPHENIIMALGSRIRPELDKAQKLSEAGERHAACDYAFRFYLQAFDLFDADGQRTLNKLKGLGSDTSAMLVEDHLHRLIAKVHLLLCLGEHQQALAALDTFLKLGKTSEQARRYDRKFRPLILRGLRKAAPGRSHPTKAEQTGAGQPATRPESNPEGGDKPQPESEGRTR